MRCLYFSEIFCMKKSLFIALIFVLTVPVFSLTVYKESVTASFYAEDFHGKRTSNGEKFNMNDLTCAHKVLPFDTILKVTNLANGKTVQVRVNDRGPFVVGREIDLSKAAAKQLNMIGSGTTKVKLEIVKMGANTKLSQDTAASAKKIMAKLQGNKASAEKTVSTKTTTAATSTSAATSTASTKTATTTATTTTKNTKPLQDGTFWDIQVGAFSSKDNATKRAKALSDAGFKNIVFQTTTSNVIRVAIKNVPAKDVPEIESKLIANGFTEFTRKQRTIDS